MATCGFCKKILLKDDFKNKKKELQLKVGRFRMISCPHCDSVLGTYAHQRMR